MAEVTALVVPDPRLNPVPRGWAEAVAAPAIDEADWENLDEYEAQLRGVASLIDSLDGDVVEFEKALRMVEKRRGELLGEPRQGERSDLQPLPRTLEVDASPMSVSRWRKIARHWDDVRERVLAATERSHVTQSAVLRLIRKMEARTPAAPGTCSTDDLGWLQEQGWRFGTVYADPPWNYGNQATRASTDNHYGTMTVEEIAAMPVAGLLADNAHLHLWTTNAFLFDARTVLEGWGFVYKSAFIWVKRQMGMGNYWRVSHEICLLGVKGATPFLARDEMSWRQWDRGQHSAKPEPMYGIIERVSPGPYLELFARRQREGWVSWGNEIDRDLFYTEAAVNG